MKIAGLILAGGLARRMGGGDKSLRLLAGRPILDHIVARLRPQVASLALNANGDPDRFRAWGLPVISDSIPGYAGPLAGVLAGLDWAIAQDPQTTDLLTVPGDTPFVSVDLVDRLITARAAAAAEIAVAASDGRSHPVVALWPIGLAGLLRDALTVEGLRRVEAFQSRFRVAAVAFPVAPTDPFFNINSHADLAVAEAIAARLETTKAMLATAESATRHSS